VKQTTEDIIIFESFMHQCDYDPNCSHCTSAFSSFIQHWFLFINASTTSATILRHNTW